MSYKPIESYGVIGDLHTVALVGVDGSIDWCCLPYFDSPSLFAAILDDQQGGFFKITALHYKQHKQMYLPDSSVLRVPSVGASASAWNASRPSTLPVVRTRWCWRDAAPSSPLAR